jgi:acetyl esterase/lipase
MPGACGENVLPIPEDPGVRGPWDVGVRTVKLGRLTLEVLYPAQPGSTAGKPEATYNLIHFLPAQEQSKIPADHSPDVGPVGGHLYRDVPIDADHGPYPVIIFIHGTASMRIGSGSTNTHWASRGNIVLAADYPGLGLLDQLNEACGYPLTGEQDIPGDVNTQLNALKQAASELQFLSDRADLKRLGISGHSQGACLTAQLANLDGVKIILPMTGSTPVSQPAPSLQSIAWIAGMDDSVIGYDAPLIGNVVCPANPDPAISNLDAYTAAPGPPAVKKRLIGIKGGGHLSVTDLCQTNKQGKNAVEEAQADGVCGVETAVIIGLPALNDCGPGSLPWMKGVEIVNYVSAAAIDETLHCQNRDAAFAMLQMRFPEIGDFRHEP